MNNFITFLYQITTIIVLSGIGFLVLKRMIISLFVVEEYAPYRDELNENINYMGQLLEQRKEMLYSLVSNKTGKILAFDTRRAILKEIDPEELDPYGDLVIFSERELSDFGFDMRNEEYEWFTLSYQVREEDSNGRNN